MQTPLASLLLLAISGLLQMQSADVKPVGIGGHRIGESVKLFLRLEPDARSEVEVCDQHPDQAMCIKLFGAVEKGQRAEISTTTASDPDEHASFSDTYNFVLDGGKLVKITVSVNDVAEVMKTYGKPSSETVTPHHNDSGAKWEDRVTGWDLPNGYITLLVDNNPVLQDRRPLLVIESREEHARANAGAPKPAIAPAPPPSTDPAPH